MSVMSALLTPKNEHNKTLCVNVKWIYALDLCSILNNKKKMSECLFQLMVPGEPATVRKSLKKG